jgi:hypothetical protein
VTDMFMLYVVILVGIIGALCVLFGFVLRLDAEDDDLQRRLDEGDDSNWIRGPGRRSR